MSCWEGHLDQGKGDEKSHKGPVLNLKRARKEDEGELVSKGEQPVTP